MKVLFFLRRAWILVFLPVWAAGWTPVPVADDPLVRMPGTQPGTIREMEGPGRCTNCHGGDDNPPFVSKGRRWQGSMMAQSARDPLFYAALTVTLQDSIWALGNPNAGDICLRCHFPKGWVEGRSDPVNATLMSGADFDGVSCDVCHSMFDPFFEDTFNGVREGNDWVGYWDEATPAVQTAATTTRDRDRTASTLVKFFNGLDFYNPVTHRPVPAGYTENASGQFFLDVPQQGDKRAAFADADARHRMLYSRHHRSRDMCASCHDVSNPVLQNLGADPNNPLPTETASAFSYFHVERTFSEFRSSGYGQPGGMAGTGAFAPDRFNTSRPGNLIANCQDCHFPNTVGSGATQKSAVVRPTESIDHPLSGQPAHDMMGGNAWIPYILASIITGSPNYSATNAALLRQGPNVLTLDFRQGESLNDVALLDASARAIANLERAAGIDTCEYNPFTGLSRFRVNNHTGHKLISGFPEGRRMFVNVRGYVGDTLVYEVNPYDAHASTLKGLPLDHSPNSPPLAPHEVYRDDLVYECKLRSDLTGEDKTFHVALATGRVKDNRIPPRGFRVEEAVERLAEPVWEGVSNTNYFTAAEYAGGYDEVTLQLPKGVERIVFRLYYQTTSREYIEFLRDQINGTATTLSSPTPSGEAQAYIIQTDPFFSRLRAWGNTIWDLWWHNRHVPGAAPVLMTDMELALDTGDSGDGIPNYWKIFYFGDVNHPDAAAHADSDGDGMTNYEEYLAMTNPLDPDCVLRIEGISVEDLPSGQVAQVFFHSHYARAYQLQTVDALTSGHSWTNVLSVPRHGRDGSDVLTHTNTVPSRLSGMYRLIVHLP